MSKESYARGFCKIAEKHGIDPVQLAKFSAPATNAPPTTLAPASTNTIRKDLVKKSPLLIKNILTRPMRTATYGALGSLGANRARAYSKFVESINRPSESDLTKKMIQDYLPSKKTIFRDKMPTPQK